MAVLEDNTESKDEERFEIEFNFEEKKTDDQNNRKDNTESKEEERFEVEFNFEVKKTVGQNNRKVCKLKFGLVPVTVMLLLFVATYGLLQILQKSSPVLVDNHQLSNRQLQSGKDEPESLSSGREKIIEKLIYKRLQLEEIRVYSKEAKSPSRLPKNFQQQKQQKMTVQKQEPAGEGPDDGVLRAPVVQTQSSSDKVQAPLRVDHEQLVSQTLEDHKLAEETPGEILKLSSTKDDIQKHRLRINETLKADERKDGDQTVLLLGGFGQSLEVESVFCDMDVPNLVSTRKTGPQAAVLDDKVYLCGGKNRKSYLQTCITLGSTGGWEDGPSMHHTRGMFQMLAMGQQLVAIAGFNKAVLDSIEVLADGQWEVKYTLTEPRYGHCAAVLSEDEFVMLGGITVNTRYLSDVEKFNVKTGDIEKLTSLTSNRFYASCAIADGQLFVAGGSLAHGVRLTSMEVLDLSSSTSEWKKLPASPLSSYKASMVVMAENIFIFGMEDARDKYLEYSIKEEKWTSNKLPKEKSAMALVILPCDFRH